MSADRLTANQVANLVKWSPTAPTNREVEALAREVEASRKLVADLRALHVCTYDTISDEVYNTNAHCSCGGQWPCDSPTMRLIEEADDE